LTGLRFADLIEREVIGLLTRKFHREPHALQEVLDDLLRWTYRVQIHNAVSGICRDPNDEPILETAVASNADLLVAGDRDLLSLKSFHGIGIVTPIDDLRISFPA
jgi:putative PIN family toxin of toxin-antitoxin system